jgi:hypothetical protein
VNRLKGVVSNGRPEAEQALFAQSNFIWRFTRAFFFNRPSVTTCDWPPDGHNNVKILNLKNAI